MNVSIMSVISFKTTIPTLRIVSSRTVPNEISFLKKVDATHRYAADPRWSASIDENAEKIESIKIAAFSALVGTVICIPIAFCTGVLDGFDPLWQIQHVALLISLVLFGITYRYAVRNDGNPQLKQGVVGSFAITRALCLVKVPLEGTGCVASIADTGSVDSWDSATAPASITSFVPSLLDCGAPFHFFTLGMLLIGLVNLLESGIAYGGTAYAIERFSSAGILKRFPSNTSTNISSS